MNATVEVNEELMQEAMRLTGLENSEEVVAKALQLFIAKKRRDALTDAFGAYPWDGDLDAMRTD